MNTCETCRYWTGEGDMPRSECNAFVASVFWLPVSRNFGCILHRPIEDVIPAMEATNQIITNAQPMACEWEI